MCLLQECTVGVWRVVPFDSIRWMQSVGRCYPACSSRVLCVSSSAGAFSIPQGRAHRYALASDRSITTLASALSGTEWNGTDLSIPVGMYHMDGSCCERDLTSLLSDVRKECLYDISERANHTFAQYIQRPAVSVLSFSSVSTQRTKHGPRFCTFFRKNKSIMKTTIRQPAE